VRISRDGFDLLKFCRFSSLSHFSPFTSSHLQSTPFHSHSPYQTPHFTRTQLDSTKEFFSPTCKHLVKRDGLPQSDSNLLGQDNHQYTRDQSTLIRSRYRMSLSLLTCVFIHLSFSFSPTRYIDSNSFISYNSINSTTT